jgi:hypothetical protein
MTKMPAFRRANDTYMLAVFEKKRRTKTPHPQNAMLVNPHDIAHTAIPKSVVVVTREGIE